MFLLMTKPIILILLGSLLCACSGAPFSVLEEPLTQDAKAADPPPDAGVADGNEAAAKSLPSEASAGSVADAPLDGGIDAAPDTMAPDYFDAGAGFVCITFATGHRSVYCIDATVSLWMCGTAAQISSFDQPAVAHYLPPIGCSRGLQDIAAGPNNVEFPTLCCSVPNSDNFNTYEN